LFLLEGGAKGGGQSVNCLGGCVASQFKTLSLCARGRFTSCVVIITYALITPGIVINTLSIFYEYKVSYCNPLLLILFFDYVCNVCVMDEALLGDMMMIQKTELVK
jgi:hypothetical protein